MPVVDVLYINAPFHISAIVIVDLNGRILMETETPIGGIDLSSVHQGMYFLEIYNGEGKPAGYLKVLK